MQKQTVKIITKHEAQGCVGVRRNNRWQAPGERILKLPVQI